MLRSRIRIQGSIFAEKDERIKVFGLNLVRQIDSLNVEVAKDGEDLGDGESVVDAENVKQAGDVLLDVQLDFERLKSHVFDSPHVRYLAVRDFFELAHLFQEIVHIFHVVVENLLCRIL